MRVGIIGGGAAGMAAAYDLSKHGHRVSVFERAPFLGGQASTFDVGGARLERGYHHLFRTDRDIVELIHELGLGPRLAWIPSKVGLLHDGRIWPFTTPTDLLRFGDLPLADRVRLGLAALRLQRPANWRELEKDTANNVLPQLVGRRAYEVMWEPLLRGKFGSYYDQVSMAWMWGKVRLRFASRGKIPTKERLGYPLDSWGEIFDRLQRKVQEAGGETHCGTAVQQVIVEDGRAVGLKIGAPDGAVREERFDAVLATVPSFIFPRLVPNLPEDYSKKLMGVQYLAAVLALLVMDRPLTPYYWISIADRSLPFVGVIEQTNFMPPEHYGGNHIVYLSNYLGKDNPHYHMDKDALLEAYIPHLQRLSPGFDKSRIREYHYFREEAAQPIIGVNYSRGVPPHHTPIKDLYLANTTQIYPEDRGTNYSVRLGRKVARIMMADHGQPVTDPLPELYVPDSITGAMME